VDPSTRGSESRCGRPTLRGPPAGGHAHLHGSAPVLLELAACLPQSPPPSVHCRDVSTTFCDQREDVDAVVDTCSGSRQCQAAQPAYAPSSRLARWRPGIDQVLAVVEQPDSGSRRPIWQQVVSPPARRVRLATPARRSSRAEHWPFAAFFAEGRSEHPVYVDRGCWAVVKPPETLMMFNRHILSTHRGGVRHVTGPP
jgi:hypothetical protein